MSKAGRPKKGSEGLPGWFDIENYRAARDFGAMKWYEQAVFRARLFESYEACVHAGDKFFLRLQPAFRMIQENPVIDATRFFFDTSDLVNENGDSADYAFGQKRKFIRKSDPAVGLSIRPVRGAGVQPLSAADLQHIEPKNYDLQETLKTMSFQKDGTPVFEVKPLKYRDRPVFALDLTIKDEIIMREMREILKAERKKTKALPLAFVRNSDFLKWYNSGVLPYLDLLLWEKMGHNFTAAAFIKALSQILDKPIGSESAVIKSAQAYAKKILDKATIRTLEAQALREYPDEAKKSGKFLVR